MASFGLGRRLAAEWLGTAFLLATVVGSGIMGERMADGNMALALLGNTIATGAILIVLILVLGPVSGAHLNPAVTLAFAVRRDIGPAAAGLYAVAQLLGGLTGVMAAHAMFDLPAVEWSATARPGAAQMFSEFVATFGLVATILGVLRWRPEAVAYAVGLFITAGYWFTASTSFANPAVTVARCLTDSFSGIHPADAPGFIAAQAVGALTACAAMAWLLVPSPDRRADGEAPAPGPAE